MTDQLVQYMLLLGQREVKFQTKKHRYKLECKFGTSLCFGAGSSGRILLYPGCLTIEKLVVELTNVEDNLERLSHLSDMENLVKISAGHIRSQIKSLKERPWPPLPDELNSNYYVLPESLNSF